MTALFLVAGMGTFLGAASEVWSQSRAREKEAELVWVGSQFRRAIESYYLRSPGSVKRFPEKLEDLLEDHRFVTIQLHLRRIYADPLTGRPDWGLVLAPSGGIAGVHSRSDGRPIRQVQGAARYSDWRFVYEPVKVAGLPPGR